MVRSFSASSIKTGDHQTYGGCKLRWFFKYVLKKPEPTTKSQEVGKQLHAQIEHYLKTGENVLGHLASAGRHMIPDPGPDLLVEYGFGGLEAGGLPFAGFIDVLDSRCENKGANDVLDTKDLPGTKQVTDWKTTGDLQYALRADQLKTDVQMISYAKYAVTEGAERVRLSHGYFQTNPKKPPKAIKITTMVDPAHVERHWGRIDRVAHELVQISRHAKDPVDVPYNTDSCTAYQKRNGEGGCPHREYCPRSQEAAFAKLFRTDTKEEIAMNEELAKKIAELEAEEAAVAASKTVWPVGFPEAVTFFTHDDSPGRKQSIVTRKGDSKDMRGFPTLKDAAASAFYQLRGRPVQFNFDGDGALKKLELTEAQQLVDLAVELGMPEVKQIALPLAKPVEAVKPLPPFVKPDGPKEVVRVPLVVEDVGLIPPDAPPYVRDVAVDAASLMTGDDEDVSANLSIVRQHDDEEVTAVERPPMPGNGEHKRGRGRPRKNDTVPTPPQVSSGFVAASPVSAVIAPSEATGGEYQPLQIYVDCYPVDKSWNDFAPELEKICEALAKQFGVVDIRCAPQDSELGYGKWKPILEIAIRKAQGKIPPRNYVLFTRTDERAQIAAMALRSVVVARGLG